MHPSDVKLVEYADGQPGRDTRRHLERGCDRCSARLEIVQEVLAALRSDRDADPPAAWVARAVALHARARVPSVSERLAKWLGGLSEEIARVVADSLAAPGDLAVAGVRSGGGGRRLRFETDEVELDLQIEVEPGTAIVTGQFVTTAMPPSPIDHTPFLLLAGESDAIDGTTDGLGEFSVDAPPDQALQLRLRQGDRVVRFDVPPEPSATP